MALPSIDAKKQLEATDRVNALLERQNALLEALPAKLAEVLNASLAAHVEHTLKALDRRRRRRSPIPTSTGPADAGTKG